MRSTLFLCMMALVVLLGCGHPSIRCPDRILGLVPISSAFTLPDDENPVPFMTRIMSAPTDALEDIAENSELITDERLGNYHIIRFNGGASVLTPRHILLTDHQIMWQLTPEAPESGSIYLHDAKPPLHNARIIAHQRTVNGGLIVLELLTPLRSPSPIRIADDPSSFRGRRCLIPIEREGFLENNPDGLSADGIFGCGDMLYVRGRIIRHATKEVKKLLAPLPHAFDGDNFVIRIDGPFDLHGASGFPVLAYDTRIGEWVMVATAISASYDKSHAVNLLHASTIDQNILREVRAAAHQDD